jgi:hypothetical protein
MLDFVAGKPHLINNPIKNFQAKKPGSFFVRKITIAPLVF